MMQMMLTPLASIMVRYAFRHSDARDALLVQALSQLNPFLSNSENCLPLPSAAKSGNAHLCNCLGRF